MNFRSLAIAAVISFAPVIALTSPASAQTRGGITLSFGTRGYSGYDYDDEYPAYNDYAYGGPQYQSYYYYDQPSYAWQVRQRREQIERWQAEQQIQRWRAEQRQRHDWGNERREHQQWRFDDDD